MALENDVMAESKHSSAFSRLQVGCKSYVQKIKCNGSIRRRLLDLGFVPGTTIEKLYESPSGDPSAYQVLDSNIALRDTDAAQVEIGDTPPQDKEQPDRLTPCGGCSKGQLASHEQPEQPGRSFVALVVCFTLAQGARLVGWI